MMGNAKPDDAALDWLAGIATAALLFMAAILVGGFDVHPASAILGVGFGIHLTELPITSTGSLFAYPVQFAVDTALVALAPIMALRIACGLARLAAILAHLALRKGKSEAGS